MTRDKFVDLLDRYNGGVEPLDNWETVDIVELIDLCDAELQRREFDRQFPPFYELVE